MKKSSLISMAVLLICLAASAQTSTRNLNDIRKKFYAEYERLQKLGQIEEEDKDGDGLMQQFRRWEYLMKSRTYPNGNIPDAGIQWREWQQYQATHSDMFTTQAALPKWQQVGTNTVPALGGGAGRINVIRIDPANTNTIFVGAAGGGVWKTINGGNTWACLSDKYPVTSIADIAIDATNSNNIYVATGDGYGYEFQPNDFWGGVYTAGIMRSADGGVTWALLGHVIPQSYNNIIQRLLIDPANNKVLLGATRTGIYRSVNAGKTWQKVSSAHCYDMEWQPGNATTVYAGGDGVLYKSADAGATWSTLKTGIGSGRMSIEVCAAEPLVVYALGQGSGFFKSSDGGTTWTAKQYPSGAGFYGYYDLMFSCSQANSNYLIAGGLTTVTSANSGTSWSAIDNWSNYTAANYVHADKHAGVFYPGSISDILLGTDGGIFKTANAGSSWTDLSPGLMIAQAYRLGTTPQNTNLVVSGWQDNGCNKWDGTNWTRIFGADGMEAAIDYTNQNTIYESYQYGALQKSLNGGTSWTSIAPGGGDWVTPFIIDPVLHTRLYYGGSSLYKSDNQGTSWSIVSGISLGGNADAIAVAPSNNNIVYVSSFTTIYKKDISTGTATNITTGLPVTTANINYITVSNLDANKVWVAMSGYSAGKKVFYSANGGTTWANISGTLPNLPVNTIVSQNNSTADRLYIGTDAGVYVRDNTVSDWIYFGNGLPNVMVHELEINYSSNKLVAATYGRGIWQVSLITPGPLSSTQISKPDGIKPLPLAVHIFPNPTTGLVNLQVQNALQDVTVEVYKLTGEKVVVYHYNADEAGAIRINISDQPYGNYIFRVKSGELVATRTVNLYQ